MEQRVAELESECTELRAQLTEVVNLSELQAAELERYKKAIEASRPNHPERAPKDQLQLAFERVVAMFPEKSPANDAGEETAQGDENTTTDGSSEQEVAPTRTNRSRTTKRRNRHGRRQLDATKLPVVIDRIVPDEVKEAGGEGYELIGEEISERIAIRPAQWFRYRTIRETYVKKSSVSSRASGDGQQGTTGEVVKILTAPLPSGIWPNVMGDPSAIADVIISKYDDLLPLNRQEDISERRGFRLPKSTQCGWIKAANAYCAPVVDAMFRDSIQNAFLIATDATGASMLPARRSDGEDPSAVDLGEVQRCEAWSVFVFIADRDHIVFKYNRKNTGAVLAEMLSGYHGHLLADAASVYDVLYREHGMTESACWFHCRRPFYRALESDKERALEALSLISELFAIDRELRLLDLELKTFTRLRRERAAPILKLFDKWVHAQRDKVDERSPLALAIGYYDNQREALHRFLDDGRIRLDNNWSEQALRKLVVGQANWVFFANENGIAWYTTFRSLIASCLLHHLNPQVYLEQLLRIVPHWPKHRVLELAPKNWLNTVSNLDEKWRSILARPWEPDVVLSAKQETRSHRQLSSTAVDSAA